MTQSTFPKPPPQTDNSMDLFSNIDSFMAEKHNKQTGFRNSGVSFAGSKNQGVLNSAKIYSV
jgi:hypothetical protein